MKNPDSEIQQEVYKKIIAFLSVKPRSKKEVSDKLSGYLKKFTELTSTKKIQIKEYIINILENSGLINDEEYAVLFVKQQINSRKSTNKLKMTRFLTKKGILSDIQQKALKSFSAEVEMQKAIIDAEKKLRKLTGLSHYEQKIKLYSFLRNKNYSGQIISAVVDSVLGVK